MKSVDPRLLRSPQLSVFTSPNPERDYCLTNDPVVRPDISGSDYNKYYPSLNYFYPYCSVINEYEVRKACTFTLNKYNIVNLRGLFQHINIQDYSRYFVSPKSVIDTTDPEYQIYEPFFETFYRWSYVFLHLKLLIDKYNTDEILFFATDEPILRVNKLILNFYFEVNNERFAPFELGYKVATFIPSYSSTTTDLQVIKETTTKLEGGFEQIVYKQTDLYLFNLLDDYIRDFASAYRPFTDINNVNNFNSAFYVAIPIGIMLNYDETLFGSEGSYFKYSPFGNALKLRNYNVDFYLQAIVSLSYSDYDDTSKRFVLVNNTHTALYRIFYGIQDYTLNDYVIGFYGWTKKERHTTNILFSGKPTKSVGKVFYLRIFPMIADIKQLIMNAELDDTVQFRFDTHYGFSTHVYHKFHIGLDFQTQVGIPKEGVYFELHLDDGSGNITVIPLKFVDYEDHIKVIDKELPYGKIYQHIDIEKGLELKAYKNLTLKAYVINNIGNSYIVV